MSDIQIINSELAPAAIGPYSQAVQHGNTLYISGQLPLKADTMEMVTESFEAQCVQVMENLKAIAEEAGGSLNRIVKLTVLLTDTADIPTMNAVLQRYIDAPYPARAAYAVKALPKDADVEIEAVMAL